MGERWKKDKNFKNDEIMTIREISPNYKVMDIPERRAVLDALDDYFNHDRNSQQKADAFFNAIMIYVDFLIAYCGKESKGASYTFDHVIPQLFVLELKNEQSIKQYLKVSLFVMKRYCEVLKAHCLHSKNVKQYKSLVLTLTSDAEWLMANHEVFNKGVTDLHMSVGSSRVLSPKDLQFALNELFQIDDCDELAYFDFRDVKPNVMFIARQLLETLGKNLIGFADIVDDNGKPIHKFTQVAWDFLDQKQAQVSQLVKLPIKLSSINAINKWTNSYVHARHLHMCYIQFYAVDVLNHLMAPPNSVPRSFDGKCCLHTMFGNFRIEHYNQLKSLFEDYIHNEKNTPDAIVKWMPVDKVGAYVLSLD